MVEFGTLSDVSLRQGWPHEAVDFTPWLADNLDRLGDVIGLPLELKEVEAKLPTLDDYFSADILAQTHDEELVLIENQLDGSDHRHLGQIMTYLPALEAKTVIWIARSFREAHLAAVKWFNEHTREEFSFFAVQLRLVRIGDSAFAPLLDVLEKPNYWEKQAQSKARAIRRSDPNATMKELFWNCFRDHYAETDADGLAKRGNTSWVAVPNNNLVVSANLTASGIVLFVRGREGWTKDDVHALAKPYFPAISAKLGLDPDGGSNSGIYRDWIAGDYTDTDRQEEMVVQLTRRIHQYLDAFSVVEPPVISDASNPNDDTETMKVAR